MDLPYQNPFTSQNMSNLPPPKQKKKKQKKKNLCNSHSTRGPAIPSQKTHMPLSKYIQPQVALTFS